jgi:hypothetical protein
LTIISAASKTASALGHLGAGLLVVGVAGADPRPAPDSTITPCPWATTSRTAPG